MEEKQLKTVSIVGALLSIVAIYIFVLSIPAQGIAICDITLEHVGMIVNVTGTAEGVLHKDNHTFFTLSDDGCEIRVVIWKSVAEGLELRGIQVSKITSGMRVNLAGEVDMHEGYLQIVPTRPNLRTTA